MRLRAIEREVARLERMAWADGRVTRRERMILERARAQHARTLWRLRQHGRYS